MAKCPKCGKQIDFLKYYVYGCVKEHNLWIADDGRAAYEYIDTVEGEYEEFCCPECGKTLFRSQEDAEKFLKGDVEAYIKAMGSLKEEE